MADCSKLDYCMPKRTSDFFEAETLEEVARIQARHTRVRREWGERGDAESYRHAYETPGPCTREGPLVEETGRPSGERKLVRNYRAFGLFVFDA